MKKEIGFLLLAYAIWGLTGIYWNLLKDVHPLYLLATRFFWSLLFCTGILLRGGGLREVRSVFKSWKSAGYMLLCAAAVALNGGLYIYAAVSGYLLEASLAYFISPVLSVLLGAFVLRERMTRLQVLSVCIAAAGILVSAVGMGGKPWLALAIALPFTAYGFLKKKVPMSPVASTCTEALYVAIPALAFMTASEFAGIGALSIIHGWKLLLLPAAGVVTSVPLVLFARGMKGTSLSLAGILNYVNPTLQFAVGILVYHETVSPAKIVTFAFVWTAVILYVLENLRVYKQERSKCGA